jgi:aflatoxin B1 aldehyde reductase
MVDQVAAFNAQFQKGKFAKAGLSNFPPQMLEEWLAIAEEKGYVKPSVYQGEYNLICRSAETALLPILRKHDMAFVGYSPLAGGTLTGKLTFSTPEELKGTRFELSDSNVAGMFERSKYDKAPIHDTIRKMSVICNSHGVGITDASLRWLLHHSALDGRNILDGSNGDALIVGPKNVEQLQSYARAFGQGPLPDQLAQELDQLWDIAKEAWT